MTEATPPEGTRLILVSEDLFAFFGTRTEAGRRLSYRWGEPDANGWYSPVLREDGDEDWLPDNAAGRRLVAIEKAARAVLPEVMEEEVGSVINESDPRRALKMVQAKADRWLALRAALEGASE